MLTECPAPRRCVTSGGCRTTGQRACLRIHCCSCNLSLVRVPSGGSSGMPPPSNTRMSATSTRSTRPTDRRLRKSSPPTNTAMSLPGFARRSRTNRSASSLNAAPGGSHLHTRFARTQRIEFRASASRPARRIISKVLRPMRKVSNGACIAAKSTSGSGTIQIVLARGSGNVPVGTHRSAESHHSHLNSRARGRWLLSRCGATALRWCARHGGSE